jgi:dipeptide/tripeptide permease
MKSILKKDGAYSLYYMGVNAGAFLGIMLCGYIGEKIPELGFGPWESLCFLNVTVLFSRYFLFYWFKTICRI